MEGLGELPYDVLYRILSLITQRDLLRISQVCTSWKEYCDNNKVWTTITLPCNSKTNVEKVIHNLATQKRFRWLSSVAFLVHDSLALSSLKRSMMVVMPSFKITKLCFDSRGARFSRAFHQDPTTKKQILLQEFFGDQETVDGGSEAIVDLSQLEELSLRCSGTENKEFVWLMRGSTKKLTFKRLKKLDLTNCKVNSEGLIEALAAQPQLSDTITYLNLSCSPTIATVQVTTALERFKNLTVLDLYSCATLNDEVLDIICSFGTRLIGLDISECWCIGKKALSAFLEKVRFRPGLKSLGLGCLNAGKHGLERLCSNPTIAGSITYLDLSMQSTKWIELGRGISDSDTHLLSSRCTKLEEICITNCPITNEGLSVLLVDCPTIDRINLSYCLKITGNGLVNCLLSPTRRKPLKYLNVRNCPNIGADDIAEIKKKYPAARIKSNYEQADERFFSTFTRRHILAYKRCENDEE